MKITFRIFSLPLLFSLLMLTIGTGLAGLVAQQRNFVLVLDAGHGGRDPGAVGKFAREKEVTLSVVRKVGAMVNAAMPDVKVVYTRKTDMFVPLEERASIANTHHADLFISVHTNAAKSRAAYGAETYTLGLAKSQSNLAVAMAENSVMMLEDDYKTRYQGFDPSSVDSYIMFEFMMDTYLDNSISFATDVQKQLTTHSRRHDRGVRQAGFWVLHRSACPSVLVELGFISNQQEELYMASERGQQEMAESIYNAFVKYKKGYDRKSGNGGKVTAARPVATPSEPVTPPATAETPAARAVDTAEPAAPAATPANHLPVYKVQIASSPTVLNAGDRVFKGVKNVDSYKEGGLYKYTVGNESDFNTANRLKNEMRKHFPDAFVIAFVGDKKISVSDALKIKK
jgi:N-acetylmuramoyl-L-alanine amidase